MIISKSKFFISVRTLMRSHLCIFYLIGFIYAENSFNKAIFECHRMPISFCCTSRLRQNCLSHCSAIHCIGDSFYKQGFQLFTLNSIITPFTSIDKPGMKISEITYLPLPLFPTAQFLKEKSLK